MAEDTKERIRISVELIRYETEEDDDDEESTVLVDSNDESNLAIEFDTQDEEKALRVFDALKEKLCEATGLGNARSND